MAKSKAGGGAQDAAVRALERITDKLVSFHREYYGNGPAEARTCAINDTIVCILHGGFTVVERTLIEAGQSEAVYQMRHSFQEAMRNEFVGAVEEATDRKVVAYMSQVHTEPDIVVELFALEPGSGLEPAEHVERFEVAP